MNIDATTVRLLGVAQLVVFAASMLSERLLASVVGSGSASEILVSITENLTRMRISNLVALALSFISVVLGVLYYVVFKGEYEVIALVALGCFLIAAITFTVGKIGANALIPISQQFVEQGSPETSYFQMMGDFLYNGVDKRGSDIHTLFSILGFLLVNYLLFISGSIPRALSIWGLVAVILALIPTLLQLYKADFLPAAQILAIPFAPY